MSRHGQAPAAVAAPWRFYLVAAALLCLALLLLGRILTLQVLDIEGGREFLKNQGDQRAVRAVRIPAYRGLITDRRGEPLAVSTPAISLWVDPHNLVDAPALARALDMPLAELEAKLQRYAGKRFMYLRRYMKPNEARKILARKIQGVGGEPEYQRYYPAGEAAGQLVGFTNADGEGIAGLELTYNQWLRGVPGRKQIIRDLHHDVVRDIGVMQPARPGQDLRLSIDLRLQYLQQRELRRAVQLTQADSGAVVTLDARTGEVLAMVSYPVYNPNLRTSIKPGGTRNRAMLDEYEPGSTMKPLTLVAALESGRYTIDTLIDTSPGRIRVGGKTLVDPRDYGEISVSRVIEKSSQVGVTRIALDIGHDPVWQVFQRLGIGQSLDTDFPGESSGLLPVRRRWSRIEEVTLAFGYGLTVTPLQLARAYTVFASGGLLRPVSLLALG
ncbi:MAG: peptidoglycan D,D-transpeptidase FtsI family protein, partial [Parahaliea sp.]